MYIAGDWEILPLREVNPGFEIDVIPHPMQVRRASSLGGSSLGIWSGSRVKEAAWAWLDFLTNEENMGVAFSYGRFPARVDAADSGYIDDPLILQFLRELPYGINHAGLVGDYSRTVLGDAFTAVMVYGEDPDRALDQAARMVQEALDEVLDQ
jgi:ABC-type glycerol-3-phosphate transport system substrate-binding protein